MPPRKKTTKKEAPYNEFTLTCLNCRQPIDEHTQAAKPEVIIFDCMNCDGMWMVKTAILVPKG